MDRAFKEVYSFSTSNSVPMRDAAIGVAVSRVTEAMKARGWI